MTTKSKISGFVMVAVMGSALAGCSTFSAPTAPTGPNEFEIVGRAPLIIPPESDLRPPRPGQPRPQEIDPTNRAIKILFPDGVTPPPEASDGEKQLLSHVTITGGSDIRSLGSRKDQVAARKSVVLADLLAMEEREFGPDNVSISRGVAVENQ